MESNIIYWKLKPFWYNTDYNRGWTQLLVTWRSWPLTGSTKLNVDLMNNHLKDLHKFCAISFKQKLYYWGPYFVTIDSTSSMFKLSKCVAVHVTDLVANSLSPNHREYRKSTSSTACIKSSNRDSSAWDSQYEHLMYVLIVEGERFLFILKRCIDSRWKTFNVQCSSSKTRNGRKYYIKHRSIGMEC